MAVLVENDRIRAVGSPSQLQAEAGVAVRTVDLGSATLLSGGDRPGGAGVSKVNERRLRAALIGASLMRCAVSRHEHCRCGPQGCQPALGA
jgi:hypothetical protein